MLSFHRSKFDRKKKVCWHICLSADKKEILFIPMISDPKQENKCILFINVCDYRIMALLKVFH